MTTPSVSVALCTHNGAAYIEEQLRSILSQSAAVNQLVVSDDASSDDTLATVERVWREAAPTAAELVVLRNETPLGVSANFAQALRACTSDIIMLSDQDDIWREDRVAAALRTHTSEPEALLVHSDARLVDAKGTDLGVTLFQALEVGARDLAQERTSEAFSFLLRRNIVTGATASVRRELLEAALPVPEDWVHDEWLALVAAARGRLDHIADTLIDYRQHGANQIGVSAPTLGYKVRRMLEPRGERNRTLARRSAALATRLDELDAEAALVQQAQAKHAFEQARALLPDSRIRRVPFILRLARSGGYERFASQGRLDIVRDLLQPA
ncbi:MAG: glycosyltransferase family 2 protein [Salinibacterium sp.]|nr:glycosyltransferase family 2 protein [Salinibacterium sp.]MBF0673468.1 glycosyltransferase family 2 protein [Salinibacterium sp.]